MIYGRKSPEKKPKGTIQDFSRLQDNISIHTRQADNMRVLFFIYNHIK